MQSQTPHSIHEIHTHASAHTRYARQPVFPVPLRRSSLSNISTTRPSLSPSSLSPLPNRQWRTKPRDRVERRGRIRNPCLAHHLPGSYPISQSPEAPACGAERATRAEEKGDRVAAYIAILCSVCKSPARPGAVAAVAPFDIVTTRLISPPSRPFPAAPASAEVPLQPRISFPPSSGPSDRETRRVPSNPWNRSSPVNSISSRTPLACRPRPSSPRPAGPPHGWRASTPSASRSQQRRTGGVSRKAHCFFRRFSWTKDPPRAARHGPDGKGPAPKCSRNAPRLAWMTPAEAINSAPQPATTTRRFGHGTCPVQPVAFARAPTQGSSAAAEQGCFVLPRCYPTHRVPQHALAARRWMYTAASCVGWRDVELWHSWLHARLLRLRLKDDALVSTLPSNVNGHGCWAILPNRSSSLTACICFSRDYRALFLVFPGSHGP